MPFASYFCLIALVWTSSATLNDSAESEHHCLCRYQKKCFLLFPAEHCVYYRSAMRTLSRIVEHSFYTWLLRDFFFLKGWWILSNVFFCIHWVILLFLSFSLLTQCVISYLQMWYTFTTHLTTVSDIFNVLWNWVC